MDASLDLIEATKIAELNDAFRKAGKFVTTEGFRNQNVFKQLVVIREIIAFDAFTEKNDPHGEHDFGAVTVGGTKFFWKIDYYDKTLSYGSEDPSDPEVTQRVLTIMLASEY